MRWIFFCSVIAVCPGCEFGRTDSRPTQREKEFIDQVVAKSRLLLPKDAVFLAYDKPDREVCWFVIHSKEAIPTKCTNATAMSSKTLMDVFRSSVPGRDFGTPEQNGTCGDVRWGKAEWQEDRITTTNGYYLMVTVILHGERFDK